MKRLRDVGVIGSTLLVLLLVAGEASAQQFMPTGKDTLRGLPGVEVLVEPLPLELTQRLTGPAIAAAVTQQLRAAGITIYPSQMQNPGPSKAYLYIHVTGFPMARQGDVLHVQAHVRQTLRSPVTSSDIVNAMTWDLETTIFAPVGTTAQAVGREVLALVSRFIQDWRSVH